MSRLVLAGAAVVLVVTMLSFAWAATNLNSSRSNIYREFPGTVLVTASTPLSAANDPATVYTTSATADFVLTQFCASPVNTGVRLAATGLGPIAHTTAATLCYTFQPGIIMPKSSPITCTTTEFAGTNSFCTIAGLLRP
jgi:hypothetical protein